MDVGQVLRWIFSHGDVRIGAPYHGFLLPGGPDDGYAGAVSTNDVSRDGAVHRTISAAAPRKSRI